MKARMAFKVVTVLTAGAVIFTATRVVNAGEIASDYTTAAETQMQQEEMTFSYESETEIEVKTEVQTEVETEIEVEEEDETETEAETEKETEARTEDDFSDDELELLAHLIYAEAGDQSDACQRATGNVVLNRMAHRCYPNSMYGVIYQKGQYACTWEGSINRTPSQQAYRNARWLLEGHRYFGSSDYVYQAQFEQGYNIVWIGTECFGTYSK